MNEIEELKARIAELENANKTLNLNWGRQAQRAERAETERDYLYKESP